MNAANLFSDAASIELIVYATQKFHAQPVDGGFALWTGGSNAADGTLKAQTVYMIKNRK